MTNSQDNGAEEDDDVGDEEEELMEYGLDED
jgi:hypothetical protein